MMQRGSKKFTVSRANSSFPTSQGASSSSDKLKPQQQQAPPFREDLNCDEQMKMVTSSKHERMAKLHAQDKTSSLFGAEGLHPQDETGILEFNRHALRLLVLEAHRRQSQYKQDLLEQLHTKAEDSKQQLPQHLLQSPPSSELSEINQNVNERMKKASPSEQQQLDLSETHNLAMLTQDIDTLLDLAHEKSPETRGRILQQMYSQLAKLCMWNLHHLDEVVLSTFEKNNECADVQGDSLGRSTPTAADTSAPPAANHDDNEDEISASAMMRTFSYETELRKAQVQHS